MRANPLIWKIAEWIHYQMTPGSMLSWDTTKNFMYDKAAVLYAKILNNDFVGPDNHAD